MRHKDVEIHARELFEMVADMRRQMAMQDGIIQRQAGDIERLRAAGDDLLHLLSIHHVGLGECVPPAGRSLPSWCSYCAAATAWREVAP